MNADSIPFRVCLHLSRNPGVALFPDQLVEMYGIGNQGMHMRLRSACKRGWLTKERDGFRVYYAAGPKLLEAMK